MPRVLSEEEVNRRITAARAHRSLVALAAVEILYSTGLRVTELLSLRQHQFASGATTLIVRGKGGNERMVLLSEAAREAAAPLLDGKEHGWIFPDRGKRQLMSRPGFERVLKQVVLAARPRPGASQPARAAALLRQPDARPRRRSAQPAAPVGHADISTTQIYAPVPAERLQELVRLHRPLSRADQIA